MDLLIVDDDINLLSLLSRMLKQRYPLSSIVTTQTGEDALRIARIDEPSLVITDFQMPGINGIELSQQLKSIPGSNVKVVLMTGDSVFRYNRDCIDAVLRKPFPIEALCKHIECYSNAEANAANLDHFL